MSMTSYSWAKTSLRSTMLNINLANCITWRTLDLPHVEDIRVRLVHLLMLPSFTLYGSSPRLSQRQEELKAHKANCQSSLYLSQSQLNMLSAESTPPLLQAQPTVPSTQFIPPLTQSQPNIPSIQSTPPLSQAQPWLNISHLQLNPSWICQLNLPHPYLRCWRYSSETRPFTSHSFNLFSFLGLHTLYRSSLYLGDENHMTSHLHLHEAEMWVHINTYIILFYLTSH